jgi:hypothetical protein
MKLVSAALAWLCRSTTSGRTWFFSQESKCSARAKRIRCFWKPRLASVRTLWKDSKFLSGEQWRVKRKEGDRVVLERNGAEKELPLTAARNFSVYAVEQLAVSVGDQVRVTKNFVVRDLDGKRRCRNNELHSVAALDENSIKLSNGVRLPRGIWHIDQGIVVTSHAAQGKTVDQVIASVPITAFGQANEAQFYVTMSRARRAMYLFTDSKAALKEAVMRTSERASAHELLAGGRRLDRGAAFAAEFERTRNHKRATTVAPAEEPTRDTLHERELVVP